MSLLIGFSLMVLCEVYKSQAEKKDSGYCEQENTMFWLNDNSVSELNKRYGHRYYTAQNRRQNSI